MIDQRRCFTHQLPFSHSPNSHVSQIVFFSSSFLVPVAFMISWIPLMTLNTPSPTKWIPQVPVYLNETNKAINYCRNHRDDLCFGLSVASLWSQEACTFPCGTSFEALNHRSSVNSTWSLVSSWALCQSTPIVCVASRRDMQIMCEEIRHCYTRDCSIVMIPVRWYYYKMKFIISVWRWERFWFKCHTMMAKRHCSR